MRIIRVGQKPQDVIFKGTCSSCKTIFECAKHEGTYYPSDYRSPGGFLKVTCPVCGAKANAYERKDDQPIPANLRDWYGDLLDHRNDSYYIGTPRTDIGAR